MGRIGLAVARRAKVFGLQIHYHNRRPVDETISAELDATYWESLDRMLGAMDVISLHTPLTPGTYHVLSARRLGLIQPHAFIINTARGELIDEAAMAQLLEDGKIAGVGLDVFEHEPKITESLLHNPRAFLMPHLGSATIETRVNMGERVIINIRAFLDGHAAPDRVLPMDLD
jgi:glyoxylate reductase